MKCAVLLAVLLTGCAFDGASVGLLRLDENTCEALPHHLPACVVGFSINGKWKF